MFTTDDIGTGTFLKDSTACSYEVETHASRKGRAICQPIFIQNMLGADRIKDWIVHCLNREVARRSYKVVCADVMRGVQIKNPSTADDLPPAEN